MIEEKNMHKEIEIWKEIEDYPLYQISSLGKVKRIGHEVELYKSNTGWYVAYRKEKILKASKNKSGYTAVKIYNQVGFSNRLVHRLVAEAFLDNKDDKPTVNHRDGVKDNNNLINLEWSTDKEQSEHANKYNLVPEHLRMKKVLAYDVSGHFVEEFQSMKDAERALDILQVRISEMCRGLRKSAYRGYFFEYSIS